MSLAMNTTIFNALIFNVAWLCCVVGGNGVALITVIFAVFIHLRYISSDYKELILFFQIVLFGFIVDSLFIKAGVLIHPNDGLFPPFWLVALWLMFATTLNHSMKFFRKHIVFASMAGAISGPLSYIAGARMSDFSLGEPLVVAVFSISAIWACVFPICLWLAKRYEDNFIQADSARL